MGKREFEVGDQVRELFSDFNGRRHLGVYGYIVDYVDEETLSILVTHDAVGIPYPSSARIRITDAMKTGKRYPN